MKVCVINGSPKGKYSVTLQTVRYIQALFSDWEWVQIDAGQRIRAYEKDFSGALEEIRGADVILFSYPVYTFLAPWQLHRFIELLKEQNLDLSGKFATQITTSKHFYDVTAHRYIEQNCQDLGWKYIRGLSADMEDLLKKEGQKAAADFWKYVRFCIENDLYELPERIAKENVPERIAAENAPEPVAAERVSTEVSERLSAGQSREADAPTRERAPLLKEKRTDKKVLLLTNAQKEDVQLQALTEAFQRIFPWRMETVNIAEYPFAGGCLGCLKCAADGTCVYKDGFADFLREKIQTADGVVYAYTVKDHSMGASFKIYDDRQFCNGHRTMTMGMPVGYLVNGVLTGEDNLRTLMQARAEVGHNYLAGIAQSEAEMKMMSQKLGYILENGYVLPQNFYGVGGMKIFRDLIYVMRGMMKADHNFYKKQGFYRDMPHKKKGTMIFMGLAGAMMSNPKISKKMGNQMNEGMILPYQKIIDAATGNISTTKSKHNK